MTERRRPEVVAFDVNETLLDLAPVRAALVEVGQPASLFGAVFARTLLTGFAGTATGTWFPFREAFDAALAQETDLPPDRRAAVADAFLELSPHQDVEPALRRLFGAGVRVVTLTHGSAGVAEAGLERGGVAAASALAIGSLVYKRVKEVRRHRRDQDTQSAVPDSDRAR